jgi:hypothetical protein
MELNGASSNPLTTDKRLQMGRLLSLKRVLAGSSAARSPRLAPAQLRQDAVLGVVTSVLEFAGSPMRVCEIHGRANSCLGDRFRIRQ